MDLKKETDRIIKLAGEPGMDTQKLSGLLAGMYSQEDLLRINVHLAGFIGKLNQASADMLSAMKKQ